MLNCNTRSFGGGSAFKNNEYRVLHGCVLAIAASVLVACGSGDDSKKATQVAAKVGGEEITVHQLNFAMARAGAAVQAAGSAAAQKQVLTALVDQQLLVNQAVSQKLDRDPVIAQAIEAAKRQVLAQAYLERSLPAAEKAAPNVIKEYFTGHPELFEKRHVYRLGELRISVAADKAELVQSQLTQAKNLNDFVAWLKTEKIPFSTGGGVKPAEDLPLGLLPKLDKMKDGDNLVMREPNGLYVVQLLGSQEQPVNEAQATPVIERFLANKKRVDFERAEIAKLRAAAKIEFLGQFAGDAAPAPAVVVAPPAGATPAPAAPAQSDFMDKGLSGLK